MDRRIAGALLLVGALIVVLGGPAWSGRRIAGAAVGTPVPGPVRVGDCLTSISGAPEESTMSATTAQLPTATTGSCGGLLVGEVVSVETSGSAAGRRVADRAPTTGDACARSAPTFLGLPATRTIAGIAWTPGLATGSQEIGPDRRQRAAGQRWSACAVTGATASYRGSIRASATGGLVPGSLGLCWPGVVKMDTELASCSAPHDSQLLATGLVDGTRPVLPASLTSSCRQYATAVLGGLDPGAVDRLTVRVAAQGMGPQVLLCSVSAAGRRQLLGSVLGIGSRPLPMTG
jgi:hypothetical protein